MSGGGAVLRVLVEPRPHDPDIWVAECLETGYIATGLGYSEAREGILEILRAEIAAADEAGRVFAQARVPDDLERRWEAVTREHPAQSVPLFPGERKPPGRVVSGQVAVARSPR